MYPTIVTALIYSQRSIADNYDLGVASARPGHPRSTPPELGIIGAKSIVNDSATVAQSIEENSRRTLT